MLLIGLDAASQPNKFGYAIGRLEQGVIKCLCPGLLGKAGQDQPDVSPLLSALATASVGLIAIDAPLGWPEALGNELHGHVAGQPLGAEKDDMFRRTTDQLLREEGRGQPLEVGADRIARAAHQALNVLRLLRKEGRQLPLAWGNQITQWSVIEVYPAATLLAHGLKPSGYKKDDQRSRRVEISQHFSEIIPELQKHTACSADEFDACLCLVAAKDFLEGRSPGPSPDKTIVAQKEGWIWARKI